MAPLSFIIIPAKPATQAKFLLLSLDPHIRAADDAGNSG